MDCLAPPLTSLSPSLTLKQWGEKRRGEEKERKQQHCSHCSHRPLPHCCSSGSITTSQAKRSRRPARWWREPRAGHTHHGWQGRAPGGLGSVPDAQPGSRSLGRLPRGLPLFLRHAPVLGRGRHQQHPGAGTAGQWERHRNVSWVWEKKVWLSGLGFSVCLLHAVDVFPSLLTKYRTVFDRGTRPACISITRYPRPSRKVLRICSSVQEFPFKKVHYVEFRLVRNGKKTEPVWNIPLTLTLFGTLLFSTLHSCRTVFQMLCHNRLGFDISCMIWTCGSSCGVIALRFG